MKQFIKRLIEAEGGTLLRGDPLDGVVPYFSGELATQSFKILRKEIHEKEAEGWVKFPKVEQGQQHTGDAAQIEIVDPDVDDVEEDEEASSPKMIQTNGEILPTGSPASSNADDSVHIDVGAGAAGTVGAAQVHSKGLTELAEAWNYVAPNYKIWDLLCHGDRAGSRCLHTKLQNKLHKKLNKQLHKQLHKQLRKKLRKDANFQ